MAPVRMFIPDHSVTAPLCNRLRDQMIKTSKGSRALVAYRICGGLANVQACVALAVIFSFTVGLRAALVPLTFDEAHSFLFYALSRRFFTVELANNHPLNTILIYVTTLFGDSPFLIRLPNYVAGVAYFALSVSISKQTTRPLIAFTMLTAIPYLQEFFSLARGYGIASTLTLAALNRYFFTEPSSGALTRSVFLLVIASYAFYGELFILAGFFPIAAAEAWRNGAYRDVIRAGLVAGLGSLFPIWAAHAVSEPGKALYGWRGPIIKGIITGIKPVMSTTSGWWPLAVAVTICCPFLLVAPTRNTKAAKILAIAAIALFLVYSAALITSNPLPMGRVLIPFLPLVLLASAISWANLTTLPDWLVVVLVLPIMLTNLVVSYNPIDTTDWRTNRVDPDEIATKFALDHECRMTWAIHPAEVYYRRRAALETGRNCD